MNQKASIKISDREATQHYFVLFRPTICYCQGSTLNGSAWQISSCIYRMMILKAREKIGKMSKFTVSSTDVRHDADCLVSCLSIYRIRSYNLGQSLPKRFLAPFLIPKCRSDISKLRFSLNASQNNKLIF